MQWRYDAVVRQGLLNRALRLNFPRRPERPIACIIPTSPAYPFQARAAFSLSRGYIVALSFQLLSLDKIVHTVF